MAGARRPAPEGQLVWIGFGGRADQPWLRLLRPGFRHCFALLRDPAGWTLLDPLSGRLVVTRLPASPAADVPRRYRAAGFSVLGPFLPAPPRPGLLPPLLPASCVTVCLRLLGLRAFVLTPHGLYGFLATKFSGVKYENILDNRNIGG